MHPHHTQRPARRLARVVLAAACGVAALTALSSSPAGAQESEDLTICHRTNSNANPYIVLITDENGQNGGTDHLGEHTGPLWNADLKKQKIEWGDVVPPTPDNPNGSEAYQDLIDLEINPDEFIRNGCETPPVPTHDVTLDKVTAGGTAPAASTQFTFTVVCQSGSTTSPVTIAPSQDPVVVAEGVAEDDTCVIVETNSAGAMSTSFQVTGGTVDGTTANSVTFGVGAEVAIVATNTYPDPTTTTTAPTTTTTTPAQVAGVQVTTTTTAPAEALAVTGSPAAYWYLLAGVAFVLGGLSLYGSTLRRLLHIRR